MIEIPTGRNLTTMKSMGIFDGVFEDRSEYVQSPSMGLVAVGEHDAFLIWASPGSLLEEDVKVQGSNLEDLRLPSPSGNGVFVFEGLLHTWGPDHNGDYDSEWSGEYRALTQEELQCLNVGSFWMGPEEKDQQYTVKEVY